MDYSYHGLLSTLENLDKRGLAHSGTGRSLEEASAPAVVGVGNKKVGIIAVDTSFNPASQAGATTKKMKARPGVNYVGFNKYYPITKKQYQALKEIAETSKVNGYHELLINGGFSLPSPDGIFYFGGINFCYDGAKKRSECNKKDKERLLKSIEKAKAENDLVILAVHCHAIGVSKHEEVPQFLEELARESVDAGCSAIICNGTHQLRPLEIYKDCPIFYSLGDFIYQGMRVRELPADFMIKYGIDANSTAWEGLMARSKNNTIGLQVHKCNFQTVLPKMTFENGKLSSLEMLPIVAGFKKEGKLDGLPYVAKGEEAQEIFETLKELSTPYGTDLVMRDGKIYLK
jgi:poly-gamma-glutamate synthesis protein (capsule biosynthesis protein)